MTLNAPHIQTEIPGPKSRALVSEEQRHLAPGLQGFALSSGIAVERAEGSVIEDVDGNRYVDLIGGIGVNSLGHCHPAYTKALHEQLDKVTVGSFTSAPRAELINEIAKLTPKGVDRVQLYSSGAEAVESAFRLAKNHTGKHEVVGFWGGFHGKTMGTLAVNGAGNQKTYGPTPPGHVLPFANCYRCPLKLTYPSCGIACADLARDQLRHQTSGAVAAVIMEPLQGTAGNVIPPPEFMQRAQELAKEHGAVFIADEMITGFGRTGTMFACEQYGIQPDLLITAKSLGGGLPLASLTGRAEIMDAAEAGGLGGTFTGNPVSCEAALAVLDVIEREGLCARATELGLRFEKRARQWQQRWRLIGAIHGLGAMRAIELVRGARRSVDLGMPARRPATDPRTVRVR